MTENIYASMGTPLNACWNTLGRVIKIRLGPESGCMPTEKAAGKMINPASIATKVSMIPTLKAVFGQVGFFTEIGGVRTKASHSQTQ